MTARRKKIQLFVALVLIACATLWYCLTPHEPEYQGKTLSEWLTQATNSPMTFKLDFTVDIPKTPANAAIRAMGTNALPFLWRELNATDSPLKLRLMELLNRLSISAWQPTPEDERRQRAFRGVLILGTNAAPLAPSFATWLGHSSERAQYASFFFHCTGTGNLPLLHEVLRTGEPWPRLHAAILIGHLDARATNHLPVLVEAIAQSTDLRRRADAIYGLMEYPTHGHEPLFRALFQCAQDTLDPHRSQAIQVFVAAAKTDPAVEPFLRAIAAQHDDPWQPLAAQMILSAIEKNRKRASPTP